MWSVVGKQYQAVAQGPAQELVRGGYKPSLSVGIQLTEVLQLFQVLLAHLIRLAPLGARSAAEQAARMAMIRDATSNSMA